MNSTTPSRLRATLILRIALRGEGRVGHEAALVPGATPGGGAVDSQVTVEMA